MATYNGCKPANGVEVRYYEDASTSSYMGKFTDTFDASDQNGIGVSWIGVHGDSRGGYAKRADVDTSYCTNMWTSFFGSGNLSTSNTEKIAVYNLQFALRRLGHPVGTIDGKFGPATKQAVIDFQDACGLDADGIVGDATKASLVYELSQLSD